MLFISGTSKEVLNLAGAGHSIKRSLTFNTIDMHHFGVVVYRPYAFENRNFRCREKQKTNESEENEENGKAKRKGGEGRAAIIDRPGDSPKAARRPL